MRWATLDSDGRPTGFFHPDVHPELFEQVDGEPRPRGPIAGAIPVTEADWQEILSHPGRRRIQGGRVVATEPPAPLPDAQAAADRALLREAMLREQFEAWIEQRTPLHAKASRPRRSPRCSGCGLGGPAGAPARKTRTG